MVDWLNTEDALRNIGLDKKLHGLLLTEDESSRETIRLIFNSVDHLKGLIQQLSAFCWQCNDLNLIAGIVSEKSHKRQNFTNFSALDDTIIFFGSDEQQKKFTEIFTDKKAFISNSCQGENPTIAYQRHLSTQANTQSVSLGEFKAQFDRAESQIRAAEALFFDLSAIRRQDSYFEKSFITGLDIYEACQLLRFCGLSKKHKMLFFNIGHALPLENSWECIATSLWYYMEGLNQKEIENTDDRENHNYLVDNDMFSQPVNFIKGITTNRWWLVHPETKEKIPCTEQDYLSLRDGHMPDILVEICMD